MLVKPYLESRSLGVRLHELPDAGGLLDAEREHGYPTRPKRSANTKYPPELHLVAVLAGHTKLDEVRRVDTRISDRSAGRPSRLASSHRPLALVGGVLRLIPLALVHCF